MNKKKKEKEISNKSKKRLEEKFAWGVDDIIFDEKKKRKE